MPVLDLVRSVLWPGFLGERVPGWLARELDGGLVGAVCFAQNLGGEPGEIARDIRSRRPHALIGVDEEGGTVTRLEAAAGSTLPGAAQLGFLDDVEATRAVGRELGRRVLQVGLDVVIAPDADVTSDPRNPVIGVRSFGSDPALVARHAAALVEGVQETGAIACAKHYPGHGDTAEDSHRSLPRTRLDWDALRREHGRAFDAAVGAGVGAIMTAHILVPGLGDAPATVNPVAIGELRSRGFDGVVVTDALDMAAVRRLYGMGGAAVRSLAAGADLLCVGNPANPGAADLPASDEEQYLLVRDAVVRAVEAGELAEERLEQAAGRVRALAERPPRPDPMPALQPDVVRGLVERAVTGDAPSLAGPVLLADVRSRVTVAVASGNTAIADEFSRALGHAVGSVGAHDIEEVRRVPGTPVVLADRVAAEGAQLDAVRAIAGARPDAVLVNLGLATGGRVAGLRTVETRGDSRVTAQALVDRLTAR